MNDNTEEKTIDIDVDLGEEPVELGYQGKPENTKDASAEELKQQAGELFKAAGGLAGSLGKFAAKKGGELKDKISDEEFQEKVKSNAKAYADKAGTMINSGAAKAEDVIKESRAAAKAKAAERSQEIESIKASASAQGGGKGNKKLWIILLAVCVVVAGALAALSGGNDEQPATEEPVAEETVEDASEETADETAASEDSDVTEESNDAVKEEEILTVDNSSELKNLLTSDDEDDFAAFAGKNAGKTIEFDCSIDHLENHENYKTRYDFLLSAGDYNEDSQDGPTFKLEDYNVSNDAFPDDSYAQGDSIHIIAEVEKFENSVFYLTPIKVTHR